MPRIKEDTQEILYPEYEVRLFHSDKGRMQQWTKDKKAKPNPIDSTVAETLLGWTTEDVAEQSYGDDYLLIDNNNQKIRCLHNLSNRPFYGHLAEAWKLEILRKKWKLNGETIIIDKYGNVISGQHRLVGLILAIQEWYLDQKKPTDKQVWSHFWTEPPCIDALVVFGIEGDDETVNTTDTGKPRTFADVIYRSEYFDGIPNSAKKVMSVTADWAVKLVWDRTAQKQVSYCPKRSHSESTDFIARHERLLKAVRFIYDCNKSKLKDNGNYKGLITLGYAAGLLYLMGIGKSVYEKYEAYKSEGGLDFADWGKAEFFWKDLATNGKVTEVLREALLRLPSNLGGSYGRDLRCGIIIKAWNLWIEEEKITKDGIEMDTYENTIGITCLGESPKIGGIDLDYAPPAKKVKEEPAKEEVTPKKKQQETGECPQGGKHQWEHDDLGTYCSKCKETKQVKRGK